MKFAKGMKMVHLRDKNFTHNNMNILVLLLMLFFGHRMDASQGSAWKANKHSANVNPTTVVALEDTHFQPKVF